MDVLQADGSRCGGITGFLCAALRVRHCEYFHDHVRIEEMLFDGAVKPVQGVLYPDLSRAGMGLELKRREAERYAVKFWRALCARKLC